MAGAVPGARHASGGVPGRARRRAGDPPPEGVRRSVRGAADGSGGGLKGAPVRAGDVPGVRPGRAASLRRHPSGGTDGQAGPGTAGRTGECGTEPGRARPSARVRVAPGSPERGPRPRHPFHGDHRSGSAPHGGCGLRRGSSRRCRPRSGSGGCRLRPVARSAGPAAGRGPAPGRRPGCGPSGCRCPGPRGAAGRRGVRSAVRQSTARPADFRYASNSDTRSVSSNTSYRTTLPHAARAWITPRLVYTILPRGSSQ